MEYSEHHHPGRMKAAKELGEENAVKLAMEVKRRLTNGPMDPDEYRAAYATLRTALDLATNAETKRAIETLLRELSEREQDADDEE